MSDLLKQTLKNIGRRLSVNGIDSNLKLDANLNIESRVTLENNIYRRSVDEGDFRQWLTTMRVVSRLPEGISNDYRRKLWITIADRSNKRRKVNWDEIYRRCFAREVDPDVEKIEIQINRDLHRTGSDLFGPDKKSNQQILKKVLMAYARWNKSVGYCQGFNMLAATILEVMEGDKYEAFEVMIHLIDDVLPPKYYTDNMTGLTVDLAVFKELMKLKLPHLAKHLDNLVADEPPLVNTFTIQWFVTLFTNSMPKALLHRIWDLVFLYGNEVLIRTALAIWDHFADQIMQLQSSNDFFNIMRVLTRDMMMFGVHDSNSLLTVICNMEPFPFPYLNELRLRYTANIKPYMHALRCLKANFNSVYNSMAQSHKSMTISITGLSGDNNNSNDSSEVEDLFEDQFVMVNWISTAGASIARLASSPSKSLTSVRGTSNLSAAKMRRGSTGSTIMESVVKQIQEGIVVIGSNNNGRTSSSLTTSPNEQNLDIKSFKRQYQKLKERQHQVQLIIKEGIQNYKQPIVIENEKESFSLSNLLSTKSPLLTKLPKKNPKINQNLTKAFNSMRKAKLMFNRSSTISSLMLEEVAKKATPTDAKEKTVSPLIDTYMADAHQQPSIWPISLDSIASIQHYDPKMSNGSFISNNRTSSSSSDSISSGQSKPSLKHCSTRSSSTSTELCDELQGIKDSLELDDNDFSDLEMDVSFRLSKLFRIHSRSHENLRSASYEDAIIEEKARSSAGGVICELSKPKVKNKYINHKVFTDFNDNYQDDPSLMKNNSNQAANNDLERESLESGRHCLIRTIDVESFEDDVFCLEPREEFRFMEHKATSTEEDQTQCFEEKTINSDQIERNLLNNQWKEEIKRSPTISTKDRGTSTEEDSIEEIETQSPKDEEFGEEMENNVNNEDDDSIPEYIRRFRSKLQEFQLIEGR